MLTFLGLIVAPALALACQGILFSLVEPSCSIQTRVVLHAVSFAFLAATVALALMASRDWHRHQLTPADEDDERRFGSQQTRRFLGACATAVAALSALLILMMWFAAWVLSPCSL